MSDNRARVLKYVDLTCIYERMMEQLALLAAGIVLVGAIAIGVIAHELTHALVLHSFGIPYEIQWFPASDQSNQYSSRLSGTWAVVTPSHIPDGVPIWGIQLSAVAPLLLTLPLLLIVFVEFPLAPPTDNPYFAAVTVAWLACSLPSPQDFSVFWHTDVAVAHLDDSPVSDD